MSLEAMFDFTGQLGGPQSNDRVQNSTGMYSQLVSESMSHLKYYIDILNIWFYFMYYRIAFKRQLPHLDIANTLNI